MVMKYPQPVVEVPMPAITELDFQEKSVDLSGTAGAASSVVAPGNRHRSFLILVNDSDVVMYASLGRVATANQGIRLNAGGGSLSLNVATLWKGEINIVAASGSGKNYTCMEVETRYPH